MNDTRNDEKNSCWGFPRDLNRETKWNSPRLPASVNMSHIMDSYSFLPLCTRVCKLKTQVIYLPTTCKNNWCHPFLVKNQDNCCRFFFGGTFQPFAWRDSILPFWDGVGTWVGWSARPISNLMGKMVVWSQAGFLKHDVFIWNGWKKNTVDGNQKSGEKPGKVVYLLLFTKVLAPSQVVVLGFRNHEQ